MAGLARQKEASAVLSTKQDTLLHAHGPRVYFDCRGTIARSRSNNIKQGERVYPYKRPSI